MYLTLFFKHDSKPFNYASPFWDKMSNWHLSYFFVCKIVGENKWKQQNVSWYLAIETVI